MSLTSLKACPFHCIDLKQKKQLSLFSLQALMRYSVRQRERERERKTERERASLPPVILLPPRCETKSQRTVRPDPPRLLPPPGHQLHTLYLLCCYHNYCWISVNSKKQNHTGDFSGKTNEAYLEAFYFGFWMMCCKGYCMTLSTKSTKGLQAG